MVMGTLEDFHHGLRTDAAVFGQQSLLQRAAIDTDADWDAPQTAGVCHRLDPVLSTDIARIDADLVRSGRDGLQGQLIVEVDIHHHWERTGLLDLGHRPGGGPIRDRHPHDLTSSRSQGPDLGQGGLHIVGAGIGHGLDGDRRPAADGDAAHMDLSGH